LAQEGDLIRSFEEDVDSQEKEDLLPNGRAQVVRAGARRASALSKLFFSWVTPLLVEGGKRQLAPDDLFQARCG